MNIQGIGTHLKVKDFAKSKAFYLSLGFSPVFEYGPEQEMTKDPQGNLCTVPEAYHGIVFEHGGCKLEIGDGHRAVKPEVFQETITSSKASLMVYVDSVAEVIRQCELAHIEIAVGPRHYYWGTIEVVIKDPDGFILVFICPYTPEEAMRVNPDETWAQPPTS
jgi:catechol 2,3-dioxygenase-like lactoylglutathione lyase family enzyme